MGSVRSPGVDTEVGTITEEELTINQKKKEKEKRRKKEEELTGGPVVRSWSAVTGADAPLPTGHVKLQPMVETTHHHH